MVSFSKRKGQFIKKLTGEKKEPWEDLSNNPLSDTIHAETITELEFNLWKINSISAAKAKS